MIWTVIEWIAILAECFMVARLMIRYFGFRGKTSAEMGHPGGDTRLH